MLMRSCLRSIIFAPEQVISVCLLSIQRISLLLLSFPFNGGSAAGCEVIVFVTALPEVPAEFF
jgi:hypothetical protein